MESDIAFLEREYNARAAVRDHPQIFARWAEQGAAARRLRACEAGLQYGSLAVEQLDIFHAHQSDAPLFVFIHGGYWRMLSSKEFSCTALGLAALGITTVVVNYALTPKVSVDEITRQMRAAVAWVLRRIERHGGDPSRVALGGHSAGAHLTAMCLQTRWREDYGLASDDPLAAAVLVSGLYDLEPLRYSLM